MTDSRSTATIDAAAEPLAFGESLSSWFIEPQLNPADCVPEETVGAYPTLRTIRRFAPAPAEDPARILQDAGRERDARIWALRRSSANAWSSSATTTSATR